MMAEDNYGSGFMVHGSRWLRDEVIGITELRSYELTDFWKKNNSQIC